MTIEQAIKDKLAGTPAISDAVDGNIFPAFRDDVTPALVYDLSVDRVEETYESAGPVHYRLVLVVSDDRQADASSAADAVIAALDGASWSAAGDAFRVLGCFYQDRETDDLPVASKNSRLAIVTAFFDLIVDAPTSA